MEDGWILSSTYSRTISQTRKTLREPACRHFQGNCILDIQNQIQVMWNCSKLCCHHSFTPGLTGSVGVLHVNGGQQDLGGFTEEIWHFHKWDMVRKRFLLFSTGVSYQRATFTVPHLLASSKRHCSCLAHIWHLEKKGYSPWFTLAIKKSQNMSVS